MDQIRDRTTRDAVRCTIKRRTPARSQALYSFTAVCGWGRHPT
jgi:hypothetical protein